MTNDPTHIICCVDSLSGLVAAGIVKDRMIDRGVEQSAIRVDSCKLGCEEFPIGHMEISEETNSLWCWHEDCDELWVIGLTWPDLFAAESQIECADGDLIEWPPEGGIKVHVIDDSPDTAQHVSPDRPWFYHASQFGVKCPNSECLEGYIPSMPYFAEADCCPTCEGTGYTTQPPGLAELTHRVCVWDEGRRESCDNAE